ncbi:ferric iron uptake transcriptional regulator [Methylophilus aquaticus]|jgi:Fur family transcriptional regulator, ferric uptake regulator|uniref:Ferric uptake regulation protein n=1 Tax=Methylophilus aquaticus TaxID=1971610 RepID=A0ABT9JSI1_9PROT|nr:ferric iron uptake transcriptional regulator [Methylophilus aquaticus]MDP8567552.1 ferric iron uptake transcriptional regulator [Methylophilus aquaticus]
MHDPKELKNAGLKATLPRLKILELFETSEQRHLSAEDIYKIMITNGEDVGLATVYRVLTQFEQAGLLVRHHFESGKAVFELNEGSHHDHIVCVQCGHVEEFCNEEIEKLQHKVAEDRGFKIHDHSLYIYADCIKTSCPHKN